MGGKVLSASLETEHARDRAYLDIPKIDLDSASGRAPGLHSGTQYLDSHKKKSITDERHKVFLPLAQPGS